MSDDDWLFDLARLVLAPDLGRAYLRVYQRDWNRTHRKERQAAQKADYAVRRQLRELQKNPSADPYTPDNPCPLVAYAGVIDRHTRKWHPPMDATPGWFDNAVRTVEDG